MNHIPWLITPLTPCLCHFFFFSFCGSIALNVYRVFIKKKKKGAKTFPFGYWDYGYSYINNFVRLFFLSVVCVYITEAPGNSVTESSMVKVSAKNFYAFTLILFGNSESRKTREVEAKWEDTILRQTQQRCQRQRPLFEWSVLY